MSPTEWHYHGVSWNKYLRDRIVLKRRAKIVVAAVLCLSVTTVHWSSAVSSFPHTFIAMCALPTHLHHKLHTAQEGVVDQNLFWVNITCHIGCRFVAAANCHECGLKRTRCHFHVRQLAHWQVLMWWWHGTMSSRGATGDHCQLHYSLISFVHSIARSKLFSTDYKAFRFAEWTTSHE